MDRRQEIIELGAFRINRYGDWLGEFHSFVRPVDHPRLSAYCIELTGIKQEQVSKAKTFLKVFPEFEDWYGQLDEPTILCTWGAKDVEILQHECEQHDMETGFLKGAINLKEQYARIHKLSKEAGLLKALEHAEIPFEGTHHRALDDAYNTGQLFIRYLDHWVY